MKSGALLASVAAVALLLLNVPEPFFYTSLRVNNLTLHSDRPFAAAAGRHVLELAEARLATSPLYDAKQEHAVYLCNSRWRQALFFNYRYGVGGVNYYPLTSHVFLRDASVETNCLIGPSGRCASGDRTLAYFIAHEITHSLTGRAVSNVGFSRLPEWKREGYADYVARGSTFNYEESKRAFLASDDTMDPAKSGLYLRFNLLVAHLLDKEQWTVQRLLTDPIEQTEVEAMLRNAAR